MRSILAALALTLASLAAHAQSTPPPPCWPSKIGALQVPGGTGSHVVDEAVMDNGIYWTWRCPDGSVGFWITREWWKARNVWEIGNILMQATSVIEMLELLWVSQNPRQATCTPTDPCDPDWLRLREMAIAAGNALPIPGQAPVDPPPPPFPTAFVAKNSTSPTRPAYAVVDGVIGTKEAGRATVGAACDCNKVRIFKGTSMYCSAPPPLADLVVLCRLP